MGFPFPDLEDELVALGEGLYFGHPSKEGLEMFGFGSFRMPAAPTQALALDMDQTPLNGQVGPKGMKDPNDLRIAVHRGAAGSQVPHQQGLAEGEEVAISLGDIPHAMEEKGALGTHDRVESLAMLEPRPIENQVRMAAQIAFAGGRTNQPVVDDPPDGRRAVPAHIR